MEDILAKIMKDSSTIKHSAVRQSCLESQEILANQFDLMRSPPSSLRSQCLSTFQLALESKNGKLISHALNGFQRLVWDKTFKSDYESADENTWLPYQLLQAVQSIDSQTDDVQVEILKVLLNMTSTNVDSLGIQSVILLISICLKAYASNAAAVKTAALATAYQTLQLYCVMLQENEEEKEENEESDDGTLAFNLLESVVEELTPVLHFMCEKLKSSQGKSIASLLLQCILSVMKNIKINIYESTDFINILWQEVCPLLVALLGSPKTDKHIVSSQKSKEGEEIGRGSGCLATAPSFHHAEAKTIYSIAIELVRLVGSVGSLRPVLESLFHRMLLYPPTQHRHEALKAIKELLEKPDLLLHLAAPPLHRTSDKDWKSLDLDLIKIAIDSLGECCHSSDSNVCYASVSCVVALLKSIEQICNGEKISPEYVSSINSQFKVLENVDYKGTKSERWLKTKSKSNTVNGQNPDSKTDHINTIFSSDDDSESFDCKSPVTTSLEDVRNYNEALKEGKDITEGDSIHHDKSDDVTEQLENVSQHEEIEIKISETDEISSDVKDDEIDTDREEIKTEISELHEEESVKEIDETNQCDEESLQTNLSDTAEIEITDNIQSDRDVDNTDEKDGAENIHISHDDEVNTISLISSKESELLKAEESEEVLFSKCNVGDDVSLALKELNTSGYSQNSLDVTSPVTESAEEALNYETSTSSEEFSDAFACENEALLSEKLISQELEAERLKKVPKTLLGQEDSGKEERERVEKLCLARLEFAQKERQNAQRFVKIFQSFLPKLLSIRSSIEADQALQEFSSNYCEDLWKTQQTEKEASSETDEIVSHITILNADGIYLALYSALLLNLKLIRSKYYIYQQNNIPLTEQQFIEEVHGSGVLVYLSATWLAELYQQVLVINLLEDAGYKPDSLENSAVINLLSGLELGIDVWGILNVSDVDGLGNSQPGTQQLADYRRLERTLGNNRNSPNIEAGRKFSRRILTCCWETVLEVLSVLLNGTNSCGISGTIGFLLGTEGAKEEHRRTKDAIANSLDGLQCAAKLCNSLGLQSYCSAVFSQLATSSCPLSEDSVFLHFLLKPEYRHHPKKSLLPGRNKPLRLHASHILSMDVILSRGLELGSHSPECWKHVFQCCLFVLQLENTYFSGHGNIQSAVPRQIFSSLTTDLKKAPSENLLPSYETNNDLSSMPGSSIPQKLNISDMIKQNKSYSNSSGVIKDHQLLEIIEALSQLVDRLFEEAASRLNLSALISFLVELCAASQTQLFTQNFTCLSSSSSHGSNLLLFHLGDVMLRCARGGRPLIHVMKSWSVVAPHFVEAACHKDSVISKKGVTTIHDIVSALLSSNSELPHFHFNESLFKPFENLLCLELCDTDVQEQIVSSICEFVEGCTTEIHSGWRPLFGALRSVRIPSVSPNSPLSDMERGHTHHLRVVLDVFEAFLATDNVFVFAYAAIDCLLCLLKHVKGPAELQDEENNVIFESPTVPLDMCLAALKYLERCSAILSSMYEIPTCPIFHSANRIQLYSEPSLVDPVIPGMEIIYFEEQDSGSSDADGGAAEFGSCHRISTEINNVQNINEFPVTLKDLDKHTGIIHVWFLLLEGLAGALATCPRRYQSHTMESLFNMLQDLKNVPGPKFGIYCVNHLLLPMLQNWLRRTTKIYRGWDNFATNFKQCCGLATDLIVDYIQNMSEDSSESFCKSSGVHLMLHQLLLILTECISQPMETISRLGCACIRHLVLSAGKYLSPELWDDVCLNMQRACKVSLHSLKQLMVCFNADSDNFYGDIGEVKVAARKDCTFQESQRLKQLSHQVFLLDCQQIDNRIIKHTYVEDDERSFTFLLFPPDYNLASDPENSVIRVPFCSLVVGLLSHQILLQTLGSMLLQGTRHMLPTLMTLIPCASPQRKSSGDLKSEMPGFLPNLSINQMKIIFSCLEDAYQSSSSFDTRPGLKFLVQKVAQTDAAANLYKQTGVSWTIHIVALFELCLALGDITLDGIKGRLCPEKDGAVVENGTDPEYPSPATTANDKPNENKTSSIKETLNQFTLLRDKFKDLCETYTEHAIDKEGLANLVDRMSEQPIFFLAAQADELSDFMFPARRTSSQSSKNNDKDDQNHVVYDSSDSEEFPPVRREDCKDKIYTLASENTINDMMSEYKKRKNQHSMPSRLREKLRRKSSSGSRKKSSECSLPEEIDLQRRNSIMKDGEAHLQVFKQLIQSFLDLHQSLPNEQFQAFLPVFFPGVQYLVAYSSDAELRLALSEWLLRLATCCGFHI